MASIEQTLFEVGSGLIIWEILSFALLLVTLRVYTWKPITAFLAKREVAVKQVLESAEKAKVEAEKVLLEARQALSSCDQQLEKVRQRARAFASQIEVDLSVTAAKEAERILDGNQKDIERMKERAIEQLRGEIGGLVVESAALLIDNTLDGARHRKLIDRVLQRLPADCTIRYALDRPDAQASQVPKAEV